MVASAKAKKYWDRILVKTLTKEQRLQVEGYLAQDEPLSNKGIAVALGWPVRMRGAAGPIIITAVKRNPIPGGKCDPHGERAAELGFWIEPVSGAKGIKRPWMGFDTEGRPIIGEDMQGLSTVQIDSNRARLRGIVSDTRKVHSASSVPGSLKARRKERREDAARVSAGTMTHAEYAVKWLNEDSQAQAPELESPAPVVPPPTGTTGVGSSPASPPRLIEDGATTAPVHPPPTAPATAHALPPRRIHGPGVTSNSLKHVGQGIGGKSSRKILLGRTRKLTRKYLPLEERIKILAHHAKNLDEPQVSFRALQELNTMDGLTAAVKDAGDAQQGSTPLFALPTFNDVSATANAPRLLMGVAPVKPPRPANMLPQDAQAVEAGGQEQFPTDEEAGE